MRPQELADRLRAMPTPQVEDFVRDLLRVADARTSDVIRSAAVAQFGLFDPSDACEPLFSETTP